MLKDLILGMELRLERRLTDTELVMVHSAYDLGFVNGVEAKRLEVIQILKDNPFNKFVQANGRGY